MATFEGGDIMPVGNGVVLMGMSERTSRQAITQVAAALFAQGAAERVVVAGMPKLRAAMHLDTVFTFADRDIVTLYPTIVDARRTRSRSARATAAPGVEVDRRGVTPFVDVVAEALGLPELRVIETGGDVYASERQQWDSGNNAVAVEPGVVFTYDRNTTTNTLLRKAGVEVITDRRRRARPRPRRRALHDLPDHPRPRRLLTDVHPGRGAGLQPGDARAQCWIQGVQCVVERVLRLGEVATSPRSARVRRPAARSSSTSSSGVPARPWSSAAARSARSAPTRGAAARRRRRAAAATSRTPSYRTVSPVIQRTAGSSGHCEGEADDLTGDRPAQRRAVPARGGGDGQVGQPGAVSGGRRPGRQPAGVWRRPSRRAPDGVVTTDRAPGRNERPGVVEVVGVVVVAEQHQRRPARGPRRRTAGPVVLTEDVPQPKP